MEGYSILATKSHIPSMLDMSSAAIPSYEAIKQEMRSRIRRVYQKPCIITEHGRVPACNFYDSAVNEAHCYHAHQLVFPGDFDLRPILMKPVFQAEQHDSFLHAHLAGVHGEYLYYEDTQGRVTIAVARPRLPRQFFRMQVADMMGRPEYANWRGRPGDEHLLRNTAHRLREVDYEHP